MKVFLTGGTGFIGSHLALALVRAGHAVTIFCPEPGRVPALAEIPGILLKKGDIRDQRLLERLVQGQDACIHTALNLTREKGHEVLIDDTLPTVFLAHAAAQAGVSRFIYTSSTAVYDAFYPTHDDDAEHTPVVPVSTAPRPASFYGATKAASESYLMAQSFRSAMRVNIIRPGYTFGQPALPGGRTQRDTRFQDLVDQVLAGEPISVIKHDGAQFVHVTDLARVFVRILESDINRHIFHVMGNTFYAWSDIARATVKLCNSSSEIQEQDLGWPQARLLWDVSDMKDVLDLEFDSWNWIVEYLRNLIAERRAPTQT